MSHPAALGIDIGGTKTLCLLVNKNRVVLQATKFKTEAHEGRNQFTDNLQESVKELSQRASKKGYKLVGAGVGFAGSVTSKRGLVKASPNLICLEGFPLGRFLEDALQTPVVIGNDVQLGLCAERKFGSARGAPNVLGVFFGTGVGGAAIINGKIYRGASGVGGQIGAILAQPVGGPEAAMSHGMLDRIASKAAIASEALVMAVKNWAPYLHTRVDTDLSKISWGILRRAIAHGDERIEAMLRARMKVVGIALSSVVNFFNPNMVVLGGGLVDEMPRLVLAEVQAGLREYLVPEVNQALKIRPAELGGNAVALGAADLALEKWLDQG